MRNIWLLGVIVSLVLVISGCVTENNGVAYKEKILGTWISEASVNQSENAIFTFYSNNTVSLTVHLNESVGKQTTYVFWFNYTIDEKTLKMDIKGKTEVLDYTFSDNYNKLTLIEEDSGAETVLFKIQDNGF
ncbi:MAG TPA: hypothetical protein ENI44_00340 [Thermoplasmatales archaeon]|nr:hypothetical protein [Thermoplasmatales archaeon]